MNWDNFVQVVNEGFQLMSGDIEQVVNWSVDQGWIVPLFGLVAGAIVQMYVRKTWKWVTTPKPKPPLSKVVEDIASLMDNFQDQWSRSTYYDGSEMMCNGPLVVGYGKRKDRQFFVKSNGCGLEHTLTKAEIAELKDAYNHLRKYKVELEQQKEEELRWRGIAQAIESSVVAAEGGVKDCVANEPQAQIAGCTNETRVCGETPDPIPMTKIIDQRNAECMGNFPVVDNLPPIDPAAPVGGKVYTFKDLKTVGMNWHDEVKRYAEQARLEAEEQAKLKAQMAKLQLMYPPSLGKPVDPVDLDADSKARKEDEIKEALKGHREKQAKAVAEEIVAQFDYAAFAKANRAVLDAAYKAERPYVTVNDGRWASKQHYDQWREADAKCKLEQQQNLAREEQQAADIAEIKKALNLKTATPAKLTPEYIRECINECLAETTTSKQPQRQPDIKSMADDVFTVKKMLDTVMKETKAHTVPTDMGVAVDAKKVNEMPAVKLSDEMDLKTVLRMVTDSGDTYEFDRVKGKWKKV